jgi:hypothetical protein
MGDDSVPPGQPDRRKRFILAVAFGTTRPEIAYVPFEEVNLTGYLDPTRIHTIETYPDDLTPVNLDRNFRREEAMCEEAEEEDADETNNPKNILDGIPCLLQHARSNLAGLGDSCKVEAVLCVPAIWKSKACGDMQRDMAHAMKQAGFQYFDMLCVSEPEAAAAYKLQSRDLTVSYRNLGFLLSTCVPS